MAYPNKISKCSNFIETFWLNILYLNLNSIREIFRITLLFARCLCRQNILSVAQLQPRSAPEISKKIW